MNVSSLKVFGLTIIVFTLVLELLMPAAVEAAPQNQASPLGTNLVEITDYSGEWPFVDAFKQSRAWISNAQGEAWGEGPELQLDADGWVTKLDHSNGQHSATTIVLGKVHPEGVFTVLYEGTGTIEYSGGWLKDDVASTPGRDVVTTTGAPSNMHLSITDTDPSDYIRNIRVLMPGGTCAGDAFSHCADDSDCSAGSCQPFESTYQTEIFHPQFLTNIRRYKVLRFMDWMRTNDSPVREYADYSEVSDARWPFAPAEIMARLANKVDADMWVNIPHGASDAFVTEFARRINSNLTNRRSVYVEYSNEIWNGMFDAEQAVAALGCQTYPELQAGCDAADTTPNNGIFCEGYPRLHSSVCEEAVVRYTSHRSRKIWDLFATEFGGTKRIIRTLASQNFSTSLHGRLLAWENTHAYTDVLAIAPYFSGQNVVSNPDVANWTLDQLLDNIEQELPRTIAHMTQTGNWLAANYPSISLVAYEGGQHLKALGALESNASINQLMDDANRHPRMNAIYTAYLNGWRQAGGKLFVHFLNAARWGKYGRWGSLERQDQPHSTSPKYQAIQQFISNNTCWWSGCAADNGDRPRWLKSEFHAHSPASFDFQYIAPDGTTYRNDQLYHGCNQPMGANGAIQACGAPNVNLADLVLEHRRKGFQVVGYSDHGVLTDTSGARDGSFLSIPAYEGGNGRAHLNAINATSQPPQWPNMPSDLAGAVDAVGADGSLVILNHPGPRHVTTDEALAVDPNVLMFIDVLWLDKGKSTGWIRIWDDILSTGRRAFGLGMSDSHSIDWLGAWGHNQIRSNSNELSDVMDALRRGDFYATNGAVLDDLRWDGSTLVIEASTAVRIEIYGSGVQLLQTIQGGLASVALPPDQLFIRAEVIDHQNKIAMTQAFFADSPPVGHTNGIRPTLSKRGIMTHAECGPGSSTQAMAARGEVLHPNGPFLNAQRSVRFARSLPASAAIPQVCPDTRQLRDDAAQVALGLRLQPRQRPQAGDDDDHDGHDDHDHDGHDEDHHDEDDHDDTPAVAPCDLPTGRFCVEYRNNTDLSGAPAATSAEADVNLALSHDAPNPAVGDDNYSVVWQGKFEFAAGNYAFHLKTQNEVRVLIDEVVVFDNFDSGNTAALDEEWVQAPGVGLRKVVVQYRKSGGKRLLELGWRQVGESCSAGDNAYCVEYFRNPDFAGTPEANGTATSIHHDWENSETPHPAVSHKTYSVRWTGSFDFDATDYRFKLSAHRFARVSIDGDVLFDNLNSDNKNHTGGEFIRSLSSGRHTVVVEFKKIYWGSMLHFEWEALGTQCDVPNDEFCVEYYANPDFSGSPEANGRTDRVNLRLGSWERPHPKLKTTQHSIRYLGNFAFDEGVWAFELDVRREVRLTVDGQVVFDNIGSYDWRTRKKQVVHVELAAGDHEIMVEYRKLWNGTGVGLEWRALGRHCDAPEDTFCVEYYGNADFEGTPAANHEEEVIDHNFGGEAPHAALPNRYYSVRWKGTFAFDEGIYAFDIFSGKEARLIVDGDVVFDNISNPHWSQSGAKSVELELTDGDHEVVVEFRKGWSGDQISLGWEMLDDE